VLLNELLITHAPRLRAYRVTPQDRLIGVNFGQEIHRVRDVHSLHYVYNGIPIQFHFRRL